MAGVYDRRRGTAIVENKNGVLVVAQRYTFLLPGGGPKGKEYQIQAAIRELIEETGLYPVEVKYLFKFQRAKVFLIRTKGNPRPRNEIKKIAYYKPDGNVNVSYNTKKIIEMYLNLKNSRKI